MVHPALETIVSSLNEAQRAAALAFHDRHLVIHAGAGTGKTQTIVARIAVLQVEHLLSPDSIHAVTFSRAGRAELGSRMERVFAATDGYVDPVLTLTLHGLSHRILRGAVGLPGVWWGKRFDVIGTVMVDRSRDYRAPLNRLFAEHGTRLLQGIRDGLPREEQVWVYAAAVDRLRQGYRDWPLVLHSDRMPVGGKLEFRDAMGRTLLLESGNVLRVMERYEAMLRNLRAHDYAGMVTEAISVLKRHPEYLADMRGSLRHMVVDEYQDTSRAQEELLRLIAGHDVYLSVVGDTDQTIYSFNGSHIGNLAGFATRSARDGGRPTTVVTLEENYRSTKAVLGVANSVIANNPRVAAYRLRQAPVESDDTAGQLRASALPVTLIRAASLMEAACWVAEECRRLIDDEEVRPGEIAVLVRKNSPRYPEADVVREALERNGVPVSDEMEIRVNWQRGQEAATWICAQNQEATLDELTCRVNSGLLDGELGTATRTDVEAVFAELRRAGHKTGQEAAETLYAGEPIDLAPSGGNGVRVGTIHGAKGLEFRVVFTLYLNAGEFPHGGARGEEIAEERRLLYVAITRARERLYVLGRPHGRTVDFYREVDLDGVRLEAARSVAMPAPPPGPDMDQTVLGGLTEWAERVGKLKVQLEQAQETDLADEEEEDLFASQSFFRLREQMARRAAKMNDPDEEDQ
jgi:DNA helicase II / ATP-dependent DNA helicase PcrA